MYAYASDIYSVCKEIPLEKMCASLSNCKWEGKDGICAQGSGEVMCKDIKKDLVCKKEEGYMWDQNKCVKEGLCQITI